MNWSQADLEAHYARLGAKEKPVLPPAKGKLRQPQMNKVEADYAQYLGVQKKLGIIAEFWFQVVTLKLAQDVRYTADFLVLMPDGFLELRDTKGAKKLRRKSGEVEEVAYTRDDARIKMHVTASILPLTVKVVFKLKNGEWQENAL